MLFKLRKARNRELYYVVDPSGKHYSKEPLPKARAQAQMRALYASERLEGGAVADELIDKYAGTISSMIGPDFQAGPAPSQQAYTRYADANRRRGITPMSYEQWSATQLTREKSRKADYETGREKVIAEVPGLVKGWEQLEADPLVSCPYNQAGETVKTTMNQSACEAARAEWEKKTHPENYYFFRPVVKGLTQVGDVAADVIGALPAPGVAQLAAEAYKSFAPPGSKFYGQGKAHKVVRQRKLRGHGFFSNLYNRVKSGAVAVVQRVKDVAKGVRRNYAPSVRSLLAKIGDRPVVSMVVRRDPIKSFLHTALNLVTLGKWSQFREKYAYDKLFHLGVEVAVKMNDSDNVIARFVIEKNEIINISPARAYDKDTETVPVPLEGSTTVNALLDATQRRMGENYFVYDAFQNNCQDFILNLLLANGLNTAALQAFVKQDVEQALSELPGYTGKLARTLTDVAALGSVALEGEGKGKGWFLRQLEKAGIDVADYLELVRKLAKRAGYNPESVALSDKAGKKLVMKKPDGGIVHFGDSGHGDYLYYSLLGNQKDADEKRRSYLARSARIPGKWKEDKFSPNTLARKILWSQ